MLKTISVFLLAIAPLMAQESPPTALPESLRIPAADKLILKAHGTGNQIYTCKSVDGQVGWALKAPDAKLLAADGHEIGRHFAGPSWEAKDGSRVVGKAAASVASPDPDSIPWLRVDAVSHEGDGLMSGVMAIQRLQTKGGKAPGAGCDSAHVGAEAAAAYEADYYFYGKPGA